MNNLLDTIEGAGAGVPDDRQMQEEKDSRKPKKKSAVKEAELTDTGKFMESFFKDVETIKGSINHIKRATTSIQALTDRASKSTRQQEDQAISQELNDLISTTNTTATSAKALLEQMKSKITEDENSGIPGKEGELRIRKNMQTTLMTKLVTVMKGYQTAQQEYQNNMKEMVTRRVKVVKPGASDQEIDKILRDPTAASSLYRSAILQSGSQMTNTYRDVAEKFQDVLKIEQSVAELHQMFLDMAFLVDQQGELFDQIEFNVETAKGYVQEGNKQLKKAIESRTSRRKKMCCLLVILIIVVIAILAPVLNTVLK